ncbi:hypothetical protein [Rhizobium ruizarguesonis]|uniref:hypothetical protein n=1 Tax=Rhizobium ruizarguesonis TaxID=2081791 RepID=UPI0010320355|nr:hypothetical protein [Rhizobium ruizarguesonis]TAV19067.1 hypothetical protein ELI35_37835 [Rhizobium ruizarguesonis]
MPPTEQLVTSELDLDGVGAAGYEVGLDLGRASASSRQLFYDLHPGNIAFQGEGYILIDWGEAKEINLEASAFLPWLADMRATWGPGFKGLLAGFLQGLRAGTAIDHPTLLEQLRGALGGQSTAPSTEWPTSPIFASALGACSASLGAEGVYVDLSSLMTSKYDDVEKIAIRALELALTVKPGMPNGGTVLMEFRLDELMSAAKAMKELPHSERSLWLLSFALVQIGHKVCHVERSLALSLLQAAQLVAQMCTDNARYLESLYAVSVHSEPSILRSPQRRLERGEVFGTLAYCHSRAITAVRLFELSLTMLKNGSATNALWSVLWSAIRRIRGVEDAFARWTNDPDDYEAAAPGLLALVKAQAASIAALISGLQEALERGAHLPWHGLMEKEIPNITTEFEWCRALVTERRPTPEFFAKHFAQIHSSVDTRHLGIFEVSFDER